MVQKTVLLHVLETSLRLLHPIMPFISEKLWLSLPEEFRKEPSIMFSHWPKSDEKYIDENDDEPSIEYENLNILEMEIAPAFRGYGKKGNIIENDLSKQRKDQIDKIKNEMKNSDRFEIQPLPSGRGFRHHVLSLPFHFR